MAVDPQASPRRRRPGLDNTFLRHVLTLMTGTAVAQVIPLVARPFLTRIYTPAEFGVWGMYTALAGGLATIGALRYDIAVVMPETDAGGRAMVKLASRIGLAFSVVATVLLTVFSHPLANLLRRPDLAPYLPAVGLLVLATTQLSGRQYWLNRRERYKEMARNRMGQAVGTTGVQLGAGLAGVGGAWGLVAGSIAGAWFSSANLWRLTRHETRPQPGDSALAVAREYRKMPLVNGPNALVDTIRLQGIILMIGAFFSKEAVGQYTQAWTLLQMPMGLVNGALGQVFYQKLANTRRGAMFGVVRNAIVRSLVIGLVPFALIWLLAPWLFPFVLGPDWGPAGQIARILVPWLYLNFVTSPISMLFLTVRRQGVMLCHALVYMAVPLALIGNFHHSITRTTSHLSWSMGGLLCGFLALALMVAWQYDHGHGRDAEPGSDEAAAERAEEAVEDLEAGLDEGMAR